MQFYTDIVDSAVFNTPVSFLHRYPNIQDYAAVIDTQDKVLNLLYLVVSREIEKASKLVEFLTS